MTLALNPGELPMQRILRLLLPTVLVCAITASAQNSTEAARSAAAPRVVDLKAADGTVLKGTYFAAGKSGPGVLLFHQINRTRESWKDVGQQLAAAGINTLTFDMRGCGESGGTPAYKLPDAEWAKVRNLYNGDRETAFQYLISQPGVTRDFIGIGGAGGIGVQNSIENARRHSAQVKSLVLLSGETPRPGLQFLHDSPGLPELFAVSDDDEYSPCEEAMQLLYASASSPSKKLVHYVEPEEAPWLWYEPFDVGKVPAKGGHGTDMFAGHPELRGIIVHWFVTTLLKTPGHAPADPIAAAPILEEVQFGGGVAHAKQQLMDARKRDPKAQLWPEISMTTVGEDFMREGDMKSAIEVFKLNLLAYPDSADVMENLAEAYLADGQKELARQHADKALALLDSHKLPASSWTDTEQYRGEIRKGAEKVLKQLTGPS
jgi:pimeloyl-ACP methyl ester carboxylesterase